MSRFEQQQDEARGLLTSSLELARAWANQEVQTSLESAAQRLDDDRFYVVVCGEFKRGKSSCLNALLSEPGFLPVDVDIATRTVTVVTYAPEERISVYLEDLPEPKVIGRAEIRQYVSEGAGEQTRPKIVTVETPNERLRSGVALVDTPGVGGLNEAHSAATFAFIPNADAVLLVADAVQPLTSSELEFASRASEVTSLFVAVVTKSDLVDDPETMVVGTRRKLSGTLGVAEDRVVVLPVSSRLRLRYLESQDPADLSESGFPALEQLVFEQMVARRGSASLVRTLRALRNSLGALGLPLRLERGGYEERAAEEAARLREQVARGEARLDELMREGAQWREDLLRGTDSLLTGLEQRCRRGFDELRTSVEQEYLYDQQLLAEPARISDRLQTEMMLLIGELGRDANRAAGRLLSELGAAADVELHAAVAPLDVHLASESGELARLRAPELPGRGQDGGTLGQEGAGTFIFGILGGLVGAGAGWLLGGSKKTAKADTAVTGWSRGRAIGAQVGRVVQSIFTTNRQLRELGQQPDARRSAGPDVETVRSEISAIAERVIDQNERQTLEALSATVGEFGQAIEQELSQRINTQRDALLRSRQALDADTDRTAASESDRKANLDETLAEIDRISEGADRLEQQIAETEPPEPDLQESHASPAASPQLGPPSS